MLMRPPTPLQMLLTGVGAAGGGAPPYVGPLDVYGGGKGAWSVYRRLLSSYEGPLFLARRGGDDVELDIDPQTDGTLNKADLEAWSIAGGGDGDVFIVTLYDQSGNGLDMEQSSAGAQMRIVSSGAIERSGAGDYPCMGPVDGNQLYYTPTFSPSYTGQQAWMFTHQDMRSSGDVWAGLSLSKDTSNNWDSSERAIMFSMSAGNFWAVRGGLFSVGFASTEGMSLVTAYFDGTGWYFDKGGDGGSDSDATMQGAFDVNRFLLAAFNPSTPYGGIYCRFTEAVIYLNDMNADAGGIRTALALDL